MTIEELARETDTPVRTVRFYISEGLLPGPGARGKAALYGEEHFVRLRLIRRLADRRVPLADIKDQLSQLQTAEIEALLKEEEKRAAGLDRASRQPAPREYVSMLLEQAAGLREGPSRDTYETEARLRCLPSMPAPENKSAQDWRRWELAPGVELHIWAGAEKRHRRLIDHLLATARDWQDKA